MYLLDNFSDTVTFYLQLHHNIQRVIFQVMLDIYIILLITYAFIMITVNKTADTSMSLNQQKSILNYLEFKNLSDNNRFQQLHFFVKMIYCNMIRK